ncbi:acyltransferase family protein [Morganella morganii]|uniref:acyltransferase family protein n=1 Tax=Morganella morganii TaxID=582 RepID=UPI0013A756C9|nr:acyltransferase family protein [Morganella morganii]
MERNYGIDNAKSILIFLVVLGHLIEETIQRSSLSMSIFSFIYSFHMPAFVMLSGVFFNGTTNYKKTYNDIVVPFLVYSVIYEFLLYYMHGEISFYTKNAYPIWIMWYLCSLAIWRVITPLFLKLRNPITISIIISLLAFNLNVNGYTFGFLRTLYFLPFFLFGFIYKEKILSPYPTSMKLLCIFIFFIISITLSKIDINISYFFGGRELMSIGDRFLQGNFTRIFVMSTSLILSILFIKSITSKRMLITNIGSRTMSIYLAHGLIIKIIIYFNLINAAIVFLNPIELLIASVFVSFLIIITTSHRLLTRINNIMFNLFRAK